MPFGWPAVFGFWRSSSRWKTKKGCMDTKYFVAYTGQECGLRGESRQSAVPSGVENSYTRSSECSYPTNRMLIYTSRQILRNSFPSLVWRGLAHQKAGKGWRISIQWWNTRYGTACQRNKVSRCKNNNNATKRQKRPLSSLEDSPSRQSFCAPST